MREEEAAWRAAAERLHRQQEEYLMLLEREAAQSADHLIEDLEVGRDQRQPAAELQRGTTVAMLKAQTCKRESASVMELQLSLQDSLDLSAAASWRHTLELRLLATELGALEEQHGGAMSRGVAPPPPLVTQQSVEALRRRADASEQEAARLHAALQQQARLAQAEREVRGEAEALESDSATEWLCSAGATGGAMAAPYGNAALGGAPAGSPSGPAINQMARLADTPSGPAADAAAAAPTAAASG